jgi:hypothetical protein
MVRLAGLPLTPYATQNYLAYSNYPYTIPVLPLIIAGGFSRWDEVGYTSFENAASPIHRVLKLTYFPQNCHHLPHRFEFMVDARRKQYVGDLEGLLLPETMSSWYTSPCRFLSACVEHWPGGCTNVTHPLHEDVTFLLSHEVDTNVWNRNHTAPIDLVSSLDVYPRLVCSSFSRCARWTFLTGRSLHDLASMGMFWK